MGLTVPRTGDQITVHLEVSRFCAVGPGGGYVMHGQAQDLAFVRGLEQGAGKYPQLVEGVPDRTRSGWAQLSPRIRGMPPGAARRKAALPV